MHAKQQTERKASKPFILYINIKHTLSDFLFFAARPKQNHGFRFE